MDKELLERAKEYAKENVKGNCNELKCLAEMLYEFAQSQLTKKNNGTTSKIMTFQKIASQFYAFSSLVKVLHTIQ